MTKPAITVVCHRPDGLEVHNLYKNLDYPVCHRPDGLEELW